MENSVWPNIMIFCADCDIHAASQEVSKSRPLLRLASIASPPSPSLEKLLRIALKIALQIFSLGNFLSLKGQLSGEFVS